MTAKTQAHAATTETILYPTDFSERSRHAFHVAQALARDQGAKLIVAHVMAPIVIYDEMGATMVPYREGEKETVLAKLRQFQVTNPLVEVEHRVEVGDAASVILDLAREKNCSLIVMGTHGRSGISRLLLGSVAEQIVRKAPCPVLTIKAPVSELPATGQTVTNAACQSPAAERLVSN